MTTTPDWHRGDWMQTYTGKQFFPLSPRAEDIDPVDIAHSLSMQCRYNGHVDFFYSVAEHCILMSEWIEAEYSDIELALWALLHDATEAYVGDMVRPLKLSLPIFSAIEDKVMVEVADKFALDLRFDPAGWEVDMHYPPLPKVTMPAQVKAADTRILLTERAALMSTHFPPRPWAMEEMEPLPVSIHAWAPHEAERAYLDRLSALFEKRYAKAVQS